MKLNCNKKLLSPSLHQYQSIRIKLCKRFKLCQKQFSSHYRMKFFCQFFFSLLLLFSYSFNKVRNEWEKKNQTSTWFNHNTCCFSLPFLTSNYFVVKGSLYEIFCFCVLQFNFSLLFLFFFSSFISSPPLHFLLLHYILHLLILFTQKNEIESFVVVGVKSWNHLLWMCVCMHT